MAGPKGATREEHTRDNKRRYGKAMTAEEILLENAATATPASQELVSTLNEGREAPELSRDMRSTEGPRRNRSRLTR